MTLVDVAELAVMQRDSQEGLNALVAALCAEQVLDIDPQAVKNANHAVVEFIHVIHATDRVLKECGWGLW